MATVGPTQSKLVDKLAWYNSQSPHTVWDRFSAEEKEQMLADDLASHPEELVDPELWRAIMTVTYIAPAFSLRGGTREILRGIIARGLGLR